MKNSVPAVEYGRGASMKYKRITEGRFISRANRFIATVEMEGVPTTVHVKNTGRCRELLVPGTTVYLAVSDNPSRKTKYDLIAVDKNGRPGRYANRFFPDFKDGFTASDIINL